MTLFPLEERSLARSRGLDVVLPDKKVAIVAERLGDGRDSGNSSAGEWGGGAEGRGEKAKVEGGVPVSIYVNYPGERKSHDRPGASSGKVGKLASSRAKRRWSRGIKAVINYAITRCYLKIKTVFFASMRLTDSHIALSVQSLSFLSLLSFSIAFIFLSVSLSFSLPLSLFYLFRPILHSCQFSSGESFWILLAAKDARLSFRRLILLLSPRVSSHLSVFSLSRGTLAGLFVTPVFSGIPDLELIFVGRKLCRSHPWINFAPSTNHCRTIRPCSLSLSVFFVFFALRLHCEYMSA